MALIRCNSNKEALGVILAVGGNVNVNSGAYNGVDDIVILVVASTMTLPADLSPQIFTAAQVLASDATNPLRNYSSGNQSCKIYYSNGNIVADIANINAMVAYKGDFTIQ